MTRARILVVEDEPIVALDLRATLDRLGYDVIATAPTGEEAVALAVSQKPDLVVMDIHLAGAMDGVQAAEEIRVRQRTAIVFLTAFSDEATLQRAKLTEPFGYAVKPFEERELHIVVQIALYKSALEARLRKSEETLAAVLRHMTDAVILAGPDGRIVFLNEQAERLTGWASRDAVGDLVTQIVDVTMGEVDAEFKRTLLAAIRNGDERRIAGSYVRVRDRFGGETRVEGALSPQKDENGVILGAVLVLRDRTHADRMDELVREVDHLRSLFQDRVRDLV